MKNCFVFAGMTGLLLGLVCIVAIQSMSNGKQTQDACFDKATEVLLRCMDASDLKLYSLEECKGMFEYFRDQCDDYP